MDYPIIPIIQAFGIVATAIVGGFTFQFYYRKTIDANWLEGFRRLYAEFWNDDNMADVRMWIVSDLEYEELEKLLTKRFVSAENKLSRQDNELLEKLDRFFALMHRIVFFGKQDFRSNDRKKLFDGVFLFWIKKLYSRKLLLRYLESYWPILAKETKVMSTKNDGTK